MQPDHTEVGRELKAGDLREGTVVITRKECGHGIMITAWVMFVDLGFVAIGIDGGKLIVVLTVRMDGTLCDDTGTKVAVYEYLGTI